MTGTCDGCNGPLPPRQGPGRPQKWCSEKCRKDTLYSGVCVQCGAPTNGSDGRGPNAAKRCAPCAVSDQNDRRHAEAIARCREIAALRARGFRNDEIAVRLKTTRGAVSALVYRSRKVHGVDMPPSPYFRANRVAA